jgi:hypothetical protein
LFEECREGVSGEKRQHEVAPRNDLCRRIEAIRLASPPLFPHREVLVFGVDRAFTRAAQ